MTARPLKFTVSEDVLRLGVRLVAFRVQGLRNRESDPEFERRKAESFAALRAQWSPEVLATDPILRGFRALHQATGRSNRKLVASSENLLGMVLKRGELPHVNLLVDLYNLVSVQTRLSLGAHDVEQIAGDVCLRLTDGTERFWPIGAPEPKPVSPGEYAYIDASNEILCRLEVRQVEKTKVTLESSDCLFLVQGNGNTPPSLVRGTAEDLIRQIQTYCGGSAEILFDSGG